MEHFSLFRSLHSNTQQNTLLWREDVWLKKIGLHECFVLQEGFFGFFREGTREGTRKLFPKKIIIIIIVHPRISNFISRRSRHFQKPSRDHCRCHFLRRNKNKTLSIILMPSGGHVLDVSQCCGNWLYNLVVCLIWLNHHHHHHHNPTSSFNLINRSITREAQPLMMTSLTYTILHHHRVQKQKIVL